MMRVAFYTRPWTAALYSAIADRWRAMGIAVDELHLTHHVEAATALRATGRRLVFLPEAIMEEEIDDPRRVLERIESKYRGEVLPMMRYILAERFFAGREHEWTLDHFARYAQFFDRFFEREAPNALIGASADIAPAWLAYAMAGHHACRSVGLIPSAIPAGRLQMLRGHQIPGAAERYEQLRRSGVDDAQRAAARALQAIVTGEGTKLDYLARRRDYRRLWLRIARGTFAKEQLQFALWQLRERRSGNWFYERNPILQAVAGRGRALRAGVADRLYLNESPTGRPFAFFPLHFQPEASTLVHGSYFENQLETVRNISRSLPIGWDLVVKEHFYMRGRRSLDYYRRLRELPNVRLAPLSYPTNRLLRDAEVTLVIASTCGLEASLIGRPVVMFGDFPWQHAPTIRKVGALVDLPATIRSAAEGALGPDHPDVLAFAASWDASLPPGRLYSNREYDWLEPENVRLLADALLDAVTIRAGSEIEGGRLPAHATER